MTTKSTAHRSRIIATLFVLGLVVVGLYGATLFRFSSMMMGGP